MADFDAARCQLLVGRDFGEGLGVVLFFGGGIKRRALFDVTCEIAVKIEQRTSLYAATEEKHDA